MFKYALYTLIVFLTPAAMAYYPVAGTYTLQADLGGNHFEDILIIEEARVYNQPVFHLSLKGFFESPGLFKVPFKGVYFPLRYLLQGRFTLDEGNGPVEYQLNATLRDFIHIEGTFLQNGQVIGTFVGEKTGGRDHE